MGPATRPTLELLTTLCVERVVGDEMKEGIIAEMRRGTLLQKQASALIDYLKLCHKTEGAGGGAPVTEPGWYWYDGSDERWEAGEYQVVRAKPPKTHLYALDVNGVFMKGMFPHLSADERMES